MGKLYVVRHGETEYNAAKRYSGSTDIEINDNGLKQAQAMAETLREFNIDLIISSPLKRALKTAEIIKEYIQKPIIVEKELAERCVGVYEGLTREEVQQKYPELWNSNSINQFDTAHHQGESIKQVRERVHKLIAYIINNYSNKNVILVTHGYIAREIYGYFNGTEEEEFIKYIMHNCQVAEYDINS